MFQETVPSLLAPGQDMGLVVSSESAGEDMGNVLYNFRKVVTSVPLAGS